MIRIFRIIVPLIAFACAHGSATPAAPATVAAAPSITGEGCKAPDGQGGVAGVVKVDGPAAKKLLADGARLIDVRAPDYYAREHIPGAINIPVAQVASRASVEIGPTNTPVILYCRTGAGSAQAAQTLVKLGYTRVYDLGSYLNWGDGAPAPTPLPNTR